MLRAIRDFIDTLAGPADEAPAAPTLELATAVLLVEVMRADTSDDAVERGRIREVLRRRFALADPEVDDLIALAQERSRTANDYFAFTSLLNERLAHPDKIAVIEQMWGVAYADGAADAGENHVISKVASLLHVTHGEYIAAKLRAQERVAG